MAENSAIEWTDHTFNPWIGCTHVSPACDNCYAEALAKARLGVEWGPGAERRRTAPSTWKQPLAWNRRAVAAGRRERVFCASLADVWDNKVPAEWRADLFALIRATPNLDWLLLSKRIGNAAAMIEAAGGLPKNVWLGATVVTQAEVDRDVPKLLATPAGKRFLSMEPLLGRVDITWTEVCVPTLDWVIVGGESGPNARPMHPDWARGLRDQCAAAGVPFLFKQWGEYGPYDGESGFAGGWLDPNGHYYGGPTSWPLAADERRAYMIRWGKKAAGRLLDGVTHDGVPA